MANVILLSAIESSVQDELRNSVGTPITQAKRIRAYNIVIDFLQGKYNWDTTKRIAAWEYLQGESDYSIANDFSVSDFKGVKDIRINDGSIKQLREFADIDEKKMNLYLQYQTLINRYTIEERDNDKILRILTEFSQGRTVVHQMDSLTANGTWASDTSTSDATTLTTDATRKKEGGASFIFNIDVSQSGNNRAQIATTMTLTTGVDGSAIENIGHFRFWLDLQSMTAANIVTITNIEFRWGSDSTNYWVDTTSTAINNGSLAATFNRLDFAWADATKVGSPDASALDYFEIRINYSAAMTDTNNIRIDEIVMLAPTEMELVYYSQFMVLAGSTRQEHFTVSPVATTETILLPTEHFRTFIKLAMKEIFPQKERNQKDYIRVTAEAEEGLDDLSVALGNEIQREQQNMRPEGQANGRVESSTQW